MLTPGTMALLMRAVPPITGWLWGMLGRMAPRNVVGSLSRTSIAVAALMVAVSVTIGVTVMITSFRHTVVLWLAQTLQSDVYISVPGGTATTPSTPIDPEALEVIRAWPGVRRADLLRSLTVDSPVGPVEISAFDNPNDPNEQVYFSADLPPEQIWAAMLDGAVLVSEPFARRMGVPEHGGEVTLYTDTGTHTFPVVGIYYDYASSQGTVLMSLLTYRAHWDDPTITAVALRLEPDVDVERTARELEEAVAPIQRLRINPNRQLREEVLIIFDRTFAITGALQLLATLVAFIGVLTLLSLQLEKQRQFGSAGRCLTTQQLWRLVLIETGLMGGVAGCSPCRQAMYSL
jgi:putative ABC transport system permease protein